MRKNASRRHRAALEALFPKVRQGVLAATLIQPEKWWYLSELAASLLTRPSSLQRELAALVGSGILERRTEGRRTYFRPQSLSPIYRDLRGIFEKTAGVIPVIRAALEPLSRRILSAFVFGSVARAQEHATSDIDLIIIGDVGLADLAPALRKAERALGRELNAITYSAHEFRDKVAKRDHLLTSVLKRPKQFVQGSALELDQITGK